MRRPGAKITKKELDIPIEEKHLEAHLDLMIWDVMGHPGFRELLQKAYFYHARGVPAVADLTRRSTLTGLASWIDTVGSVVGACPRPVRGEQSGSRGERGIRPGGDPGDRGGIPPPCLCN